MSSFLFSPPPKRSRPIPPTAFRRPMKTPHLNFKAFLRKKVDFPTICAIISINVGILYLEGAKMNKLPPLLDKAIKQLMRTQVKKLKFTMLQKRKFYAAWLMLAYTKHNFPLKAIAEEVKVSYQLLRDWRTEERFKKGVGIYTKVYARNFVDMLEKTRLSYGNCLHLVEREIPYYSLGLQKAISTEHAKRMMNVAPTSHSSPEQDRKFLYLSSFASFINRYRVDRWGSKKERLDLHETTYKLLRLADKTLPIIFEKSIKNKDFQLAREIFDTALGLFKGRRERLYRLEKILIKQNWREYDNKEEKTNKR